MSKKIAVPMNKKTALLMRKDKSLGEKSLQLNEQHSHHRGKSSISCQRPRKNASGGRSVIEGSRVNEICGNNYLAGCLGNSCL